MSIRLHPDVAVVETEDGAVLLQQRTGRYWQLNVTGTHIVQRLLDGSTAEQVANELASRYRIEADHAHADVTAVLHQLAEARLVEAMK